MSYKHYWISKTIVENSHISVNKPKTIISYRDACINADER